jgi:hypothetical protein
MILSFSTQLNGRPTYFVEKIVCGLFDTINITKADWHLYSKDFESRTVHNPKLHTIREDKNERWKPGTKIDFFINCRQKNMFRFAPVLPVVSTQKVEIIWIGFSDGYRPWVKIDNKNIYTIDRIDSDKMQQLAQNDGFDTIEDFFAYFNKDFKGKIIHWTDLKY